MTVSAEDYPCPVCGGLERTVLSTVRDVEYYSTDEMYSYCECRGCGVVYLPDPPKDRLDVIYPDTYYSFSGNEASGFSVAGVLLAVKQYLDKRFLSRIVRRVEGERLSALDIGGGTGFILDALKACDARVTDTCVVDLNSKAKAIAERNGHRFVESTIEDAALDRTFDIVIMYNLIEHVADPKAVLAKISSVMNDGGYLILKTPRTEGLDFRMYRNRYWGGYHAPRHFVLFNIENFRTMLAGLDFSEATFSNTQGATQWAFSVIGTRRLKAYPARGGENGSFANLLLTAMFAAFDLVTVPFMKKDQMFIIIRK